VWWNVTWCDLSPSFGAKEIGPSDSKLSDLQAVFISQYSRPLPASPLMLVFARSIFDRDSVALAVLAASVCWWWYSLWYLRTTYRQWLCAHSNCLTFQLSIFLFVMFF
jgi:hypothetical protein